MRRLYFVSAIGRYREC